MGDRDSGALWFSEPTVADVSLRRGEQPAEWLARSTTAGAQATRRFLNDNLAYIPEVAQPVLAHTLKYRWQSALFELIVARTLQLLGAELLVEPESEAGTRIDFRATFPDTTVSVEAISPQFHLDAGNTMRDHQPLLAIIEEVVPPAWSVIVWDLPALGLQASRREFRRVVTGLLDIPPPADYRGPEELRAEFESGDLRLRLWPRSEGGRPIAAEMGVGFLDDSERRIRQAVKRKRRQARGSDVPALVAINGSGLVTDFRHFDMALLGHRVAVYGDGPEPEREYFKPDGEFDSHGDQVPTFAGALAFLSVNQSGGPDPILYQHPRFTGVLPESFTAIEQRTFDAAVGNLMQRPADQSNLLDGLNPVSLSVFNDAASVEPGQEGTA